MTGTVEAVAPPPSGHGHRRRDRRISRDRAARRGRSERTLAPADAIADTPAHSPAIALAETAPATAADGSAVGIASAASPADRARVESAEGGIWPVFVGLQLVLLACFLLLVGSDLADPAAPAVAARHGSPAPLPPPAATGEPPSADARMLGSLGADLESLLSPLPVQRAERGPELRLTLPADALLPTDDAAAQTRLTHVLDRIVAALTNVPDGLRLEVGLRLPDPIETSDAKTSQEGGDAGRLVRSRAMRFARALLARGGPADVIAVGFAPGPADQAVLTLRLAPARPAPSRSSGAGAGVPEVSGR